MLNPNLTTQQQHNVAAFRAERDAGPDASILQSSVDPSFSQMPPAVMASSLSTAVADSLGSPHVTMKPRSTPTKSGSKRSRTDGGSESAIKRGRSDNKPEKSSKGLRHFAMKVCKKVKEKGVTTYNEVADELVIEQQAQDEANVEVETNEPHGPKNIRRRVYDALNVLMAMNIISKEKKEIKWIGLPSNSTQEHAHMQQLKRKKQHRIGQKGQYLQDLIMQHIAFKNLLKRNGAAEASGKTPPTGTTIHLPFIIINTNKSANINCQMAGDKAEYYFDFNQPFEIHDDMEVLKRMGLGPDLENGECTPQQLEEAKNLVPRGLEGILDQMCQRLHTTRGATR